MIKYILVILLFSTLLFSADWWGKLPSPTDLNMDNLDAGFYYGILGLVCGYSFVHHFRSF